MFRKIVWIFQRCGLRDTSGAGTYSTLIPLSPTTPTSPFCPPQIPRHPPAPPTSPLTKISAQQHHRRASKDLGLSLRAAMLFLAVMLLGWEWLILEIWG